MKANNNNTNKSARKNSNTILASAEWYQEFVRHVELRNIAPRTLTLQQDHQLSLGLGFFYDA